MKYIPNTFLTNLIFSISMFENMYFKCKFLKSIWSKYISSTSTSLISNTCEKNFLCGIYTEIVLMQSTNNLLNIQEISIDLCLFELRSNDLQQLKERYKCNRKISQKFISIKFTHLSINGLIVAELHIIGRSIRRTAFFYKIKLDFN